MTGFWSIVIVKDCCVCEPAALLAVIVYCAMPSVPARGVPMMVAVPLPLSLKVSPAGSLGLMVSVVLEGTPAVVVIVKV